MSERISTTSRHLETTAKCETDGHIFGPEGVCVICSPEPTSPHALRAVALVLREDAARMIQRAEEMEACANGK